MIGLEIIGGLKRDRELAEEIIWFCLEKMLPRHQILDITLYFEKTYEDGDWGRTWSITNREYEIEIDHRLSKDCGVDELISTICHEMIHVKQGVRKEMIDSVRVKPGRKDKIGNREFVKLWYCRDGKYRDYKNTEYRKRPWEVEAWRDASKYVKEFKKEYYGYG